MCVYRCNCYSLYQYQARKYVYHTYTIISSNQCQSLYAIVISVHLICTETLIVRVSSDSFFSFLLVQIFGWAHSIHHVYERIQSTLLLLSWHWYNFVVRFCSCLLYLCALVHNIISIPIIKPTTLLCLLCLLFFFCQNLYILKEKTDTSTHAHTLN